MSVLVQAHKEVEHNVCLWNSWILQAEDICEVIAWASRVLECWGWGGCHARCFYPERLWDPLPWGQPGFPLLCSVASERVPSNIGWSYSFKIVYLFLFYFLTLFKTFLKSEYNCFTILCWFLLYSKVNQLYIHIYLLFFEFPSDLGPHRAHRALSGESAMLYSRFSLVIYFMCVYLVASVTSDCDPMVCGPPGSSVHGILKARILEWIAMPSSRGFSQPMDWTWVLCLLHWQKVSLPLAPPGKSYLSYTL